MLCLLHTCKTPSKKPSGKNVQGALPRACLCVTHFVNPNVPSVTCQRWVANLVSQRIAIANLCVFKSQLENHNSYRKFRREIAEISHHEIEILAFRNHKIQFQIAMFFPLKQQRQVEESRCDFWGARFRIAMFPGF